MSKDNKKGVKADSYDEKFRSKETRSVYGIIADIDQFYLDDPLARKIVDIIPEEMVTPGFNLDGDVDEKEFKSVWDGMKLNQQIIDAFCWERLHGGSAIVAMVKDNRALTSPVKEGAQLESIRVYTKTQVKVKDRETNSRNPRYGLPKTYTISPGNALTEYDVHFSRIYVNLGERTPEAKRKLNGGWGDGVLTKGLIEAIQDYNYCEELATQLLRRKQQAVWKARNLAELCDDDDGRATARLRLAQVDDNGGVGRAIGIDALEEEYDVLNSDISGVDTFLDKKMDRIVNYSGIHEIILKNRNVGGVSQSQNVALETFYKLIERRRKERYLPLLEWLIPMLITQDEWSIRFEPLSVPTEKEQAETFNKNVDSVTKLVQEQIIDANEARDTIDAMSDIIKLKEGAITLPPRDTTGDPASNDKPTINTPNEEEEE